MNLHNGIRAIFRKISNTDREDKSKRLDDSLLYFSE